MNQLDENGYFVNQFVAGRHREEILKFDKKNCSLDGRFSKNGIFCCDCNDSFP